MHPDPAPPTEFGVLIANWNGEAFIERCLGSVLAAARLLPGPVEVVVVDDASADGSCRLIERGFPAVRLLRLQHNVGFAEAVNIGMRGMNARQVFLLNNDLALRADFCQRLLETWSGHGHDRLFAVGARTLDWITQAPNHGGQRVAWRTGMLWQEPFESSGPAPTVFFQAGACLVDRSKFLQLGGFADLYHPGYWEDYDLAWQAHRRGWDILYEPRAIAYHCGKSSMDRRLGRWGVGLTTRRNHLLFIWSNLDDLGLIARHLVALGRVVFTRPGWIPGEAGWGRALLAALRRLPAVLRLRRARKGLAKRSDRDRLKTTP